MNTIATHTRVIGAIREYRLVRDAREPRSEMVDAWLEIEAALDALDEVEKNDGH